VDVVAYTTDLSDPETSGTATREAGFQRTAYVRYAAYAGNEVVLRGGFPFFGPARWDAAKRTVSVFGATRLRYTLDGTYPVPIRPDWALSRSAVVVVGDTLSLDGMVSQGQAGVTLRVVPIVVREDGKEALGDTYAVGLGAAQAPGVVELSPLAAVEDLSKKE
jgi:hypothetical protein